MATNGTGGGSRGVLAGARGGGRDANENRFLKTCDIADAVPESLARRAALLRRLARRGSAVDALVVAFAEPGGTVLTSDPDDLEALAANAADVLIERIEVAVLACRSRHPRWTRPAH